MREEKRSCCEVGFGRRCTQKEKRKQTGCFRFSQLGVSGEDEPRL